MKEFYVYKYWMRVWSMRISGERKRYEVEVRVKFGMFMVKCFVLV